MTFAPPTPADREVPAVELLMWVLFGVSGWWSANAVTAELPLFVARLPAAEKLGNQLALMTQMGNAFLLVSCTTWVSAVLVAAFAVSFANSYQAMGTLSLVGCSFMWDIVVDKNSIPLLACMILSGGVGCMSTATYWAFMIAFPPVCTKALGFGMSLGGVLTMVLTAVQMGGCSPEAPRFGVSAFFSLATLLQLLWWGVVLKQQHTNAAQRSPRKNAGVDPMETISSHSTWESSLVDASAPEVLALKVCSFCIHATTYALPSVLPFAVSAYRSAAMKQQLLLWMMVSQQVGEACGRMAAPIKRKLGVIPGVALGGLAVSFATILTFAVNPSVLANALSFRVALVVLPGIVFCSFFCYGVLQTLLFLRVTNNLF
mmetsp:Transcript_163067/g.518016  ORF Transcript_163067/g.518016 Transcript_163067/m.518016 type:complete len:373 (+) Transcript_163067:301-1419(+)